MTSDGSDRRVTLALPGSLDRISGGTLYDKAMVEGLRGLGWRVDVSTLPDSFPQPSNAVREASLKQLRALSGPVIVDGLALGALGSDIQKALPPGRLIALVHHPLADEGGMGPERRTALTASEAAALQRSGKIITTSRFTAARIQHLFGPLPGSITAIPPGVPKPHAVPPSSPLPRAGATLRLVGLGSFIPRKRWPLLLAVLGRLKAYRWTLDLIGPSEADPPETQRIRSIRRRMGLQDHVTLLGSLPSVQVAGRLDRAHLLIHPAAYEGYGMALAEAVARGLPVLCTSGGATAEAADKRARIMIPPDDPIALYRVLRDLLAKPRKALSPLLIGARAAARTARGWDQVARDWDHCLTQGSL